MINRIHALVDAFAHLYGFHDPRSDAYQLRNPLLLKAFSPKHQRDEQGRRVFSSFISGYDNAVVDATIKCSGKSHNRNLTPESTLRDLVVVYGNHASATRSIKNFLRAALNTEDVYESTKLGWFIENEELKEMTNGR